jgi:WD40 repeat protein
MNDNQLVSTCGDGSVKLWDLQSPGFPLMSWEEHTQEVYAVDWNLITKDQFATGSWDDTIKLWSPESPTSIGTVRSCPASPIHQGASTRRPAQLMGLTPCRDGGHPRVPTCLAVRGAPELHLLGVLVAVPAYNAGFVCGR